MTSTFLWLEKAEERDKGHRGPPILLRITVLLSYMNFAKTVTDEMDFPTHSFPPSLFFPWWNGILGAHGNTIAALGRGDCATRLD